MRQYNVLDVFLRYTLKNFITDLIHRPRTFAGYGKLGWMDPKNARYCTLWVTQADETGKLFDIVTFDREVFAYTRL